MFDIPADSGASALPNPLDLYDIKKRGAVPPEYSRGEHTYRNEVLNGLQLAYNVREQPQMELNDKPYSMAYLINRQQGMAYNPPRLNPTDSRIVTGVTHEKENTIQQIVVDMNLQPQVCAYDEDDPMMVDFVELATAVLKKSLEKEGFQDKIGDYVHINIEQGNVFIENESIIKTHIKKVCLNPTAPMYLQKFATVIERGGTIFKTREIPNTAVYMPNLLEWNLHKQPRIWVVMHVPRTEAEKMFGHFPRWANVPVFPSSTVPPNTNGIWGDFYLQQPQKDYVELILTESEVMNDINYLVNGVLMLPVEESDNKVIGYPLTQFSPSGCYTLIKGDNERIPFYAYCRSIPSKNEVKEEVANEFLRIAVHKFRYSAFPSIGNNSDKILPATIWNPSEVIPDISGTDLSILNPNGALEPADFSFYQMIMQSIDMSSVSDILSGNAAQNGQTATESVMMKKQALQKLGITIDGTTQFLKEIYWQRLWNELEYLDNKKEVYDATAKKFVQDYEMITASSPKAGSGNVQYHLQDDISNIDPYELFMQEKKSSKKMRHVYVDPKVAKATFKKLRDKIYIKVVSEPDGQNQSLLGILFNLLTQYSNLQGHPIPNLNYEYLDKIIGQNSGFDIDKIFLPNQPRPQVPQPGQPLPPGQGNTNNPPSPSLPNIPGISTPAKPPQNAVLAGNP